MFEAPDNHRGRPGPPKITGLLGLGLDNTDGHKRVTRGERFLLVGGSEQTHERMTETTLRTLDEIRRRHKKLETLDPRELAEIIHKASS
ncbi:MAG: hypothetical protein LBR12_02505 [Opitutaceae bacterium]|jgi:hypothetical protein|nr:hypothetical protein [Opitutaceae bacterium]